MTTVNVCDYGAFGDGIHDDTDAIQAACAAAVPGDTVFLPAGEYMLSRQVHLSRGVTMEGVGIKKRRRWYHFWKREQQRPSSVLRLLP